MSATCKWSMETRKVEAELISLIMRREAEKKESKSCVREQHSWPWKVTDNDLKCFYVQIGQIVSMEGVSEIQLLVQAFPCLFPQMTHRKVLALANEMSLKQFARHMALLSDN